MAVLTQAAPQGTAIRERFVDHVATYGRMLRDLGPQQVRSPQGIDLAHSVAPRINAGRWIGDCLDPACMGAELVTRSDPTFYCWSCCNAWNGNLLLPVAFPDEALARQVEHFLLIRPHVDFMNWDGFTSLTALIAEGPFHRSWTTPRTWTTGEVVTATMLNTHVRDNFNQTSPALVTTAGDLVYATALNALARLGTGTANQVLYAGAAPSWGGSAKSTLTATGDVLYASGANTLARLAIGGTGAVMKVAGGIPAWLALGSALQLMRVNAGGTDIEWGSIASPEWVVVSNGAITNASNIDLTSLSGYKRYRLILEMDSHANLTAATLTAQINAHASGYYGVYLNDSLTVVSGPEDNGATSWSLLAGGASGTVIGKITLELIVQNGSNTTTKMQSRAFGGDTGGGGGSQTFKVGGGFNSTTDGSGITEIKVTFNQAYDGRYILEGSNS